MRLLLLIVTLLNCDLVRLQNVSISDDNRPIVVTKYGAAKGISELVQSRTVLTFRSIPYAKPPVGDLRFRAAQPPQPWPERLLDASEWPPQCPQLPRPDLWNESQISFQKLRDDENCLFLNVWLPTCDDKVCQEKLPVFVYIHGGSFISLSSSSTKLFDGKVLASLGKVIVVTLNYRLGLLGFLYANHTESPGNQALTDAQTALEWVRENIASFGGDPSEITVGGESAGSIFTTILYLNQALESGSGHHEPWVKRWIISSGLPIYGLYETRLNSYKRFQALSDFVGCNTSANDEQKISCLRRLKPKDLLDAQVAVGVLLQGLNPIPTQALPTIGVEPFENSIFQRVTSKRAFHKTQVLITNMFAEGTVFMRLLDLTGLDSLTDASRFGEVVRKNSAIFDVNEGELKRLAGLYHDDEYGSEYWEKFALIQMLGDRYFNCPAMFFADELTARGVEVHQALFSYCNPSEDVPGPVYFNGCKYGAQHGGDIKSVFGIPMIHEAEYPVVDRVFARKVIEIFSSFVRTGNLPWPRTSFNFGIFANFEYELNLAGPMHNNPMRMNPREAICDTWAPYIWPLYSKADKCEVQDAQQKPIILPEEHFDTDDSGGLANKLI